VIISVPLLVFNEQILAYLETSFLFLSFLSTEVVFAISGICTTKQNRKPSVLLIYVEQVEALGVREGDRLVKSSLKTNGNHTSFGRDKNKLSIE
jgi:hypothetical protein